MQLPLASPRQSRRVRAFSAAAVLTQSANPMKKFTLVSLFAAAVFAASALFAADKEVTLVGAGQCAKCSLGIASTCQNALVMKVDGKDQVFLLAKNDVSEKFHDQVCTDTKQIKVTGVVKDVDGKKEITATHIELVKG